MKVLLYKEDYDVVKDSGVGKAIKHQEKALSEAGINYTTDIKDNYDIVHINTVFPKSYIFTKKCKKKGIPVVYHAHSTEEDFKNSFMFSNQLAPFFKKWLIKCYNNSDLILTPTEYSKELLQKYNLKSPIEVISNGIDLNFWKAKPSDRSVFDEQYNTLGKKVIVSVGLYIKRKGILDFVELAKRMPEYEFIWFGYTDPKILPQEVRQAVNVKLPNLKFPGYVSSEELRLAYSASDLYFFPTYEETEGIVLLEALATGTNVLVRAIDIYSSLKDGEQVYKASSVDEFEVKIRGVLTGELPNISKAGHKFVEDKDIAEIGRRLGKLYEEVLSVRS